MKRSLTRPFLFLAAILGLGAWFYLKRGPQENALATRELATRGLAEYLARAYPKARALIISNPFTQDKPATGNMVPCEQAGLRGLHRGFADKIMVEAVAFPELMPGARENPHTFITNVQTTTPLGYLMAADAFDERNLRPLARAPRTGERDLGVGDPERIQYTASSGPPEPSQSGELRSPSEEHRNESRR